MLKNENGINAKSTHYHILFVVFTLRRRENGRMCTNMDEKHIKFKVFPMVFIILYLAFVMQNGGRHRYFEMFGFPQMHTHSSAVLQIAKRSLETMRAQRSKITILPRVSSSDDEIYMGGGGQPDGKSKRSFLFYVRLTDERQKKTNINCHLCPFFESSAYGVIMCRIMSLDSMESRFA